MFKSKYINVLQNNRIKNFVIYGIGQVVNLVSPLLVMPYLVAICEKEGLGKIGVGFSFALIFIVLVDFGSYINGTEQERKKFSDELDANGFESEPKLEILEMVSATDDFFE